MAERGHLVIADITGYTAFLSDSELEHAEDSLKDLLDLTIGQTKPPRRLRWRRPAPTRRSKPWPRRGQNTE